MRTRTSWPLLLTVRTIVGLSCALLVTGAVVAAPVVEIDQNPLDCFGECPRNWSAPVVSIQQNGLFIEGNAVTEASLSKVLRAESKKVSGRWVFVRADADVPYGKVLRICRLIEASGFRGRVRILNEELE